MGKKMTALDWPNLNKYLHKNNSLLPLEKGEKRVVFMGDSITEFWSILNPEFFDSKPYVNRGISGQTTPQMLIRFRADVIDLKPKLVILLAGINDIAENTGPSTIEMIANNIFSMVELAIANHIKIILCSVLPASDFPWRQGLLPAPKIISLNKTIKDFADSKGIHYLDFHSSMKNEQNGLKSIYSEDGVHPNKMGYEVMNSLTEAAIQFVLNQT